MVAPALIFRSIIRLMPAIGDRESVFSRAVSISGELMTQIASGAVRSAVAAGHATSRTTVASMAAFSSYSAASCMSAMAGFAARAARIANTGRNRLPIDRRPTLLRPVRALLLQQNLNGR